MMANLLGLVRQKIFRLNAITVTQKACLCHSSKFMSLGDWYNCPIRPVLPRICCVLLTLRQCSFSVDRPLWPTQGCSGLGRLYSWSRFWECSSATSAASESCVKAQPFIAWFLEALETTEDNSFLMRLLKDHARVHLIFPRSPLLPPTIMWEKGALSKIVVVVGCWWTLEY